jgi:hypothetical protein
MDKCLTPLRDSGSPEVSPFHEVVGLRPSRRRVIAAMATARPRSFLRHEKPVSIPRRDGRAGGYLVYTPMTNPPSLKLPRTSARRPGRLSLAGRSPAWPASVSPTTDSMLSSFRSVNGFSEELRRILARRSRTDALPLERGRPRPLLAIGLRITRARPHSRAPCRRLRGMLLRRKAPVNLPGKGARRISRAPFLDLAEGL